MYLLLQALGPPPTPLGIPSRRLNRRLHMPLKPCPIRTVSEQQKTVSLWSHSCPSVEKQICALLVTNVPNKDYLPLSFTRPAGRDRIRRKIWLYVDPFSGKAIANNDISLERGESDICVHFTGKSTGNPVNCLRATTEAEIPADPL